MEHIQTDTDKTSSEAPNPSGHVYRCQCVLVRPGTSGYIQVCLGTSVYGCRVRPGMSGYGCQVRLGVWVCLGTAAGCVQVHLGTSGYGCRVRPGKTGCYIWAWLSGASGYVWVRLPGMSGYGYCWADQVQVYLGTADGCVRVRPGTSGYGRRWLLWVRRTYVWVWLLGVSGYVWVWLPSASGYVWVWLLRGVYGCQVSPDMSGYGCRVVWVCLCMAAGCVWVWLAGSWVRPSMPGYVWVWLPSAARYVRVRLGMAAEPAGQHRDSRLSRL